MHISTKTLYVTLLSVLGASKAAFASPDEDAFGVTNYGFQCNNRIYPKYKIYAASNYYCGITKMKKFWDPNSYSYKGYRSKNGYSMGTSYDLFSDSDFILPILVDGTLYPFDMEPEHRLVENLLGGMIQLDPGPDRLVIDANCNVKSIFIDLDYPIETIEARAIPCEALRSKKDYLSALARSPRAPKRFREPSPEPSPRSREGSPPRSREGSPPRSREGSPQRSREGSPQRSREGSPQQSP